MVLRIKKLHLAKNKYKKIRFNVRFKRDTAKVQRLKVKGERLEDNGQRASESTGGCFLYLNI